MCSRGMGARGVEAEGWGERRLAEASRFVDVCFLSGAPRPPAWPPVPSLPLRPGVSPCGDGRWADEKMRFAGHAHVVCTCVYSACERAHTPQPDEKPLEAASAPRCAGEGGDASVWVDGPEAVASQLAHLGSRAMMHPCSPGPGQDSESQCEEPSGCSVVTGL